MFIPDYRVVVEYFWSKVPVCCKYKLGFRIDLSSCILTFFDGRFMTDFSVGRFRRKYRLVVHIKFCFEKLEAKRPIIYKMVEITKKKIPWALSEQFFKSIPF